MKALPNCCTDLIALYIAIDLPHLPREGAALCCPKCWARLVHHEGKWRASVAQTTHELSKPARRIVNDADASHKLPFVARQTPPRVSRRPGKQLLDPLQGGLLDALD